MSKARANTSGRPDAPGMNTMKTRGDAECVPDTVPGSTGTGATGMRQLRLTTRATSQSVGWQSIGAILALVVGLVIGWVPAAADVAAPVATSEATTVATPSATVNAILATPVNLAVATATAAPIRKRGTQASPCVGSTDECPVQMGLRFANLTDAATSTFRVGDTVAVSVVIKSAIATKSFGLATYLDFDTADYQLLSQGPNPVPAAPGASGVFDVSPQKIGRAHV